MLQDICYSDITACMETFKISAGSLSNLKVRVYVYYEPIYVGPLFYLNNASFK